MTDDRTIAMIASGDSVNLRKWVKERKPLCITILCTKNGVGFEIVEAVTLEKLRSDLKDALHLVATLKGNLHARERAGAKREAAKLAVKGEEAPP